MKVLMTIDACARAPSSQNTSGQIRLINESQYQGHTPILYQGKTGYPYLPRRKKCKARSSFSCKWDASAATLKFRCCFPSMLKAICFAVVREMSHVVTLPHRLSRKEISRAELKIECRPGPFPTRYHACEQKMATWLCMMINLAVEFWNAWETRS